MSRRERGQAVPVVVLLILVAGGALVLVGRLGRAAVDRARATTAADAAALGGALDGEGAARDLAGENGARVISTEGGAGDLIVTVRVGAATATARAVAARASGRDGDEGLVPAMVAALARAEQVLGEPLVIVSGRRTRSEQQALWDRREANPYPVAVPGTSNHERGLAVDLGRDQAARLAPRAVLAGLCLPLPISDPVHFELCRWSPR